MILIFGNQILSKIVKINFQGSKSILTPPNIDPNMLLDSWLNYAQIINNLISRFYLSHFVSIFKLYLEEDKSKLLVHPDTDKVTSNRETIIGNNSINHVSQPMINLQLEHCSPGSYSIIIVILLELNNKFLYSFIGKTQKN